MKNIILTGLSGCGKTTTAKILSQKLKIMYFDTDAEIERTAGKSVKQIFDDDGEQKFRSIESSVISLLSVKRGVIISTGGGAVLRQCNICELKQNGVIFYLKKSPKRILDCLKEDTSRPLLLSETAEQKLYKLSSLFEQRSQIYKSTADFTIDAELLSPEQTANSVIKIFAALLP
jgi:shikimate kinase